MAESEELMSLLMRVKEESENVGLKLNIQKNKIMTSGPITSWQINGKTMEIVREFILGAPKSLQMVTAVMKPKDKAPWKKSYYNLDSILKSRGITLPTNVHLVETMVFPVGMYGWENWIIKKAEHRRIDALNCGVREDS